MGIERGNDLLPQIAKDYAMAVRVDLDGGTTCDYHTIETPHSRPGKRFFTRRDELAGKTGLVPTRRDYRQDVRYTIAFFPLCDFPVVNLETLRIALQKPRYALYAGRRSCQLSEPPNARIKEVSTVSDALGTVNIVFDSRLDPGECKAHHSIERHDFPVGDRKFKTRSEWVV